MSPMGGSINYIHSRYTFTSINGKFYRIKIWDKAGAVNSLKSRVSGRGQTAEARRTTILQPVEQKLHSQKDRQDEKAEGYVPDEGTK